jgi:hypothetical protein
MTDSLNGKKNITPSKTRTVDPKVKKKEQTTAWMHKHRTPSLQGDVF